MRPSPQLIPICLCIAFGLFYSVTSHAEIYRWVDAEGKTHFGDKPPIENKAEDITDSVEQQNIDYSSETTKGQVLQIQRNRSALETEKRQIAQQQPRENSEAQCERARRALKIINGRVIFRDKEGNEIKTTEKERAQKAAELEAEINRRCQ